MSAGKLDLVIEQGATFTRTFVWKSDGVPVVLSGYSAQLQVRKTAADEEVLFEASTALGGLTINANAGEITLTISATDTAAFDWRFGKWDLELTSPGGIVTRLIEGEVSVSQEVTK